MCARSLPSFAALATLMGLNPGMTGPPTLTAQIAPLTTFETWAPGYPQVGSANASLVPLPDSVHRYPRTYWKDGLLVGGVLGGLLGGALGAAVCGFGETESNCTGSTIGGAVMFGASVGAVGALIGGLFPKPPPNDVTEAQ